jgi:hypothetical protein
VSLVTLVLALSDAECQVCQTAAIATTGAAAAGSGLARVRISFDCACYVRFAARIWFPHPRFVFITVRCASLSNLLQSDRKPAKVRS